MKPASFELRRPERIEDALAILSDNAESAKVIAGGQSLVPLMNLRMATPGMLIDLGRVSSLRTVAAEGGRLLLGATVRQSELLRDPLIARHAPLLRAAAHHIGHVQTRSRGTIGGSTVHADPAAEIPVALVALGATLTLASARGEREVAAIDFFLGALTTAIAEDEILIRIAVPSAPEDSRVSFREVARRHGDFAITAVAVQRSGATVTAAIGGVEPAPVQCALLAEADWSKPLAPAEREAIVAREVERLEPMNDVFAGAEYRATLARVLLSDALADVLTDG